jgi:thioredoxin 1
MRVWITTLLLILSLTPRILWAAGGEPPALFDSRPFQEAKDAAAKGGKLCLVDATATWCGPCKMMDRTTWVEGRVVKWIGANAIAVQIDVDAQKQLAGDLQIKVMPTIIVFKGGKEMDRSTGYMQPDALLEWLEGLKAGERAVDRLKRKAAESKVKGNKPDIMARVELARALVQAKEFDEAATELTWLWENAVKVNPAMQGVRIAAIGPLIQDLAAENEPARTTFTKIRDNTETRLKADNKTWEDLIDWLVLNDAVGDPDRTLAWFDRIKGDPESAETLERMGMRLEPMLLQRNRLADAACLWRDPVQHLKQERAMFAFALKMSDPGSGESEELKQAFRPPAAMLYAGLLAAGRDKDAERVATEVMKTDNGPGMKAALVSAALEANQPREVHLFWAEESIKADGIDTDLTARVRAALKAKPERK